VSAREGERGERIGRNEAVFRAVNEKIEAVNLAFGEVSDRMQLVCECGDAQCAEPIELTLAAYESLRSDATLFSVVPGHELPEAEQVVERHEGYSVVRKLEGIPNQIARETDPRSSGAPDAS
jgi:hypothetical protein